VFNPSSPVTGGPQTGFTSPTYTIVADNAPSVNAKQYYVSALGGTQSGASASSLSSPFTLTMYRPSVFASAGKLDSNNVLRGVGYNDFALLVRKGMLPLAGQQPMLAQALLKMRIPGGADLASPAEIRAMMSLMAGALWAQSAGVGDSLIAGTV